MAGSPTRRLRGAGPRRWRTVLAAGALTALPATATGCSSATTRTIDAASASDQISGQLAARYHATPTQVACPSGVEARRDRTFVCTAVLDGHPIRMQATVTATSGTFTVEPVDPILVPSTVAEQLSRLISARIGRPASVTCPGGAVVVVPVHRTLTCVAAIPGASPRQVVVTVVDRRGDFGYQLSPAS